jgi:hypothetical protein
MEAIPAYYEAAKQILKSTTLEYCSWDLSKFRWSVRFSKRFDYCFKK